MGSTTKERATKEEINSMHTEPCIYPYCPHDFPNQCNPKQTDTESVTVQDKNGFTITLTHNELIALAKALDFYMQDTPGPKAKPEELQTYVLLLSVIDKLPDELGKD